MATTTITHLVQLSTDDLEAIREMEAERLAGILTRIQAPLLHWQARPVTRRDPDGVAHDEDATDHPSYVLHDIANGDLVKLLTWVSWSEAVAEGGFKPDPVRTEELRIVRRFLEAEMISRLHGLDPTLPF